MSFDNCEFSCCLVAVVFYQSSMGLCILLMFFIEPSPIIVALLLRVASFYLVF